MPLLLLCVRAIRVAFAVWCYNLEIKLPTQSIRFFLFDAFMLVDRQAQAGRQTDSPQSGVVQAHQTKNVTNEIFSRNTPRHLALL